MDSLTSGQIHVGAGMDLPAWTAASLRPLWLNYDLSSVVSEIWWFIYSPFYSPPFHLKTSHGVSLRTYSIKIGVKNYSFWVTWWRRPHDSAIISFDALLACDGQTDGRTDGQTRHLCPNEDRQALQSSSTAATIVEQSQVLVGHAKWKMA